MSLAATDTSHKSALARVIRHVLLGLRRALISEEGEGLTRHAMPHLLPLSNSNPVHASVCTAVGLHVAERFPMVL